MLLTENTVEYACQVEFYLLSADRSFYIQYKTVPVESLHTTRMHKATFTHSCQEIFFFTKNERGAITVNIIEEDDSITQRIINRDSQLAIRLQKHNFIQGIEFAKNPWA